MKGIFRSTKWQLHMFWRLVKCKRYVEVPEVWHSAATARALTLVSVGLFHITHATHATAALICLIPRKHNVMSANMCAIFPKR